MAENKSSKSIDRLRDELVKTIDKRNKAETKFVDNVNVFMNNSDFINLKIIQILVDKDIINEKDIEKDEELAAIFEYLLKAQNNRRQ